MNRIYNWLLSEHCVKLIILGTGIYSSFLYALRHFEIVSDSEREYAVYLIYVKQGYWSPIIDNMLASSLWTTYLPSIFQHIFELNDPTIIYRIVLAILVSPLPLLIYMLVRHYTTEEVSVLLTVVLYTTFYYQAFTSYARGQVALSIAVILLMLILSKRTRTWWQYPLIIVTSAGLVVAHYTTAFIYSGIFIGAGGLLSIYFLTSKRQRWNSQALTLLVTGILLLGMARWWYGLTEHGAWTYATGLASVVIEDTNNLIRGIPWTTSSTELAPLYTPSQDLGIQLAKGLLLERTLILGALLINLQRNQKMWTKEGVLLFGSLLAVTLSLVIPKIDYWLSALRIGYTLLPIQLVSIAYWWGKDRKDRALITILAVWSIIYH